MAINIDALLSKKSWTGDEVGKAIILSLIDAYKQTLQGRTTPKELFTAAQLRTMVHSLKDKEQGTRYNRYIGLNNWISQNNAVSRAYYEQARGEVNRLLTIITTAHATEDEYRYIEKLPTIMTQKQYDDSRLQGFVGNERAILNGIAILRPSDTLNHSSCIDARGYYTEPERVNNISLVCGIEQFTLLNAEYVDNIEQLEVSRKTILDSYYYLMGYDKAVELVAEHIDLPDFTIFKTGKEDISGRINAMNNLAIMLYRQVKDTDYRDKGAKEIKLQVLKDYFQPLEWKGLAIPEEAIAKAKALLHNNMKAFEIQDGVFLGLLTNREEAL